MASLEGTPDNEYTEGRLTIRFPLGWVVGKYDDWAFYRNHFCSYFGGTKGVDFVALEPNTHTLWLVELKDHRVHPRTKDGQMSLWDEVALKARDTLAGLVAAATNATSADERAVAAKALRATRLRVVLHLEQPRNDSKLFRHDYRPADVMQKLAQVLRPIDAHPKVVELANMHAVPWHARPS